MVSSKSFTLQWRWDLKVCCDGFYCQYPSSSRLQAKTENKEYITYKLKENLIKVISYFTTRKHFEAACRGRSNLPGTTWTVASHFINGCGDTERVWTSIDSWSYAAAGGPRGTLSWKKHWTVSWPTNMFVSYKDNFQVKFQTAHWTTSFHSTLDTNTNMADNSAQKRCWRQKESHNKSGHSDHYSYVRVHQFCVLLIEGSSFTMFELRVLVTIQQDNICNATV